MVIDCPEPSSLGMHISMDGDVIIIIIIHTIQHLIFNPLICNVLSVQLIMNNNIICSPSTCSSIVVFTDQKVHTNFFSIV